MGSSYWERFVCPQMSPLKPKPGLSGPPVLLCFDSSPGALFGTAQSLPWSGVKGWGSLSWDTGEGGQRDYVKSTASTSFLTYSNCF